MGLGVLNPTRRQERRSQFDRERVSCDAQGRGQGASRLRQQSGALALAEGRLGWGHRRHSAS